MKKLAICLAVVVAASAISAQPAFAIKPFADAFAEKYGVVEPSTDAQKNLAAAVKEAKCALCHDAKDKKIRNEYGAALDELLDKADYSTKRRKAEPEAVQKELYEALEKVEALKDPSGRTFGEKIKAGELPSPPAAES